MNRHFPNDDIINLDGFHDLYFRAAVERHVQTYRTQFGERLLAVYVWGSVHRNEAVRGISDMDLHAFITDALNEADQEWYGQARRAMDAEFPGLAALSRPLSASLLIDGTQPDATERARNIARAFGFRLRYDATRVWGRELVTDAMVPAPDRKFAEGAFQAVRDLTRFAAGLDRQNRTDFDLPQDPMLRLRKLARLGVLSAGYLLMARGQFRSFQGSEILPLLTQELPEWTPFLRETQRLYILPPSASPEEVESYQVLLLPWIDWVNQHLNGP